MNFDDAVFQFISSCCQMKLSGKEGKGSFYEGFSTWCSCSGFLCPSVVAVAQSMKNLGYKEGRTKSKRFWVGVELNDNGDDEDRSPPSNLNKEDEGATPATHVECGVVLPRKEDGRQMFHVSPAQLLSLRQAGWTESNGTMRGHLAMRIWS